jgi:Ca2+-transporting ATPase
VRNGKSLFKQKFTDNVYLLGAVGIGFLLQFAVIYIPFFNGIFGTVALSFKDLMVSLGFSTLILWVYEIVKAVKRKG